MSKLNYSEIEKKWQKYWQENQINKTNNDFSKDKNLEKKKFYILDMFPYPSGEGLHVGHPKGYIATDVYSRMKKMQGYNVLHPMGWDAFGLPAEQFAIKNKINPNIATEKNVKRYKEQIEMLGLNYDWEREINTTDPKFYKWTQWMWKQMYKDGLAFESFDPINWCPSCRTGLANEDLDGNACERCGTIVEKKKLRQWTIRITDYADRLLNDLDKLNWEPHIKELQRNWIGKSEGSEIDFYISPEIYGLNVKTNYDEEIKTVKYTDARKRAVAIIRIKHTDKFIGFKVSTDNFIHLAGGGIELGENSAEASKREVEEEIGIKDIKYICSLASFHGRENYQLFEIEEDYKVYPSELNEKDGVLVEFTKEEILKNDWPQVSYIFNNLERLEKINFRESKLKIFTTRADTLFGCTFMAISYTLAKEWIMNGWNASEEIKNFINKLEQEEKERTVDFDMSKLEKEGVDTGIKAINPANGEEVPIYIANYILSDYGTGAIMAVPAHDERDFEFAKKYNLEIRDVVERPIGEPIDKIYTGYGKVCNSASWANGLLSEDAISEIVGHVDGKEVSKYKLKDWVFARQRYWGEPFPIVFDQNPSLQNISENEIITFGEKKEGAKKRNRVGIIIEKNGKILLEKMEDKSLPWTFNGDYFLLGGGVEKDENFKDTIKRELKEELDIENYEIISKLGDFNISWFSKGSNKDYEIDHHIFYLKLNNELTFSEDKKVNLTDGRNYNLKFEWIDIGEAIKDFEENQKEDQAYALKKLFRPELLKPKSYAVADKELPVILPNVENYEPTGTGESPLANIKDWVEVFGFINENGEFESSDSINDKNPTEFFGAGEDVLRPDLEIINRKGIDVIIKDKDENFYFVKDKNLGINFVGGGIDNDSEIEAVKRELIEETGFIDFEIVGKLKRKIIWNGYHINKKRNQKSESSTYVVELKSDTRVKSEIETGREDGIHELVKLNKEDCINNINYKNHKLLFQDYLNGDFIEIKKFYRETNTMPQWAGSSWYYLRYIDPKNDDEFVNKDLEKKWNPVDFYVGGAEHATRHLIYARFWHKYLFEKGYINYDEPFSKLQTVGLIMAEDGKKMSKRYGNVVNPDDVVKEYGADAMRTYEMFMGPFEKAISWNTNSIAGVSRFLERVYNLIEKVELEKEISDSREIERVINETIKKVGEDIEGFKFNTAISQMMICLNSFEEEIKKGNKISKNTFSKFIQILSPFSVHICEEIWQNVLGNNFSIHSSSWPQVDVSKIVKEEIEMSLQISGKFRGTFLVKNNIDDEEIKEFIKGLDLYKKYILNESEIKKIIIVKNRLINIVI